MFHEAAYLDRHHRFDQDNQYGYKSKVLKKQAQERIGFSRTNAHKLVKTASWMVTTHQGKDELKWFDSLTPSHLYELSRMSDEAYQAVKDEVTYEGWYFCAGQKSISVRRLEQIRRLYPTVEEVKGSDADSFRQQNNSSLTEVQQVRREPALENCSESGVVMDLSVATNIEKLRQLVILAKTIDAVRKSDVSQEILSSMPDTLSLIF